jgi:hypothetical protein
MRRREFTSLLDGAVATWPTFASADRRSCRTGLATEDRHLTHIDRCDSVSPKARLQARERHIIPATSRVALSGIRTRAVPSRANSNIRTSIFRG